jgi:hypothetical protein
LLLDPEGDILRVRARDEMENLDDPSRENHMRSEICMTMSRIYECGLRLKEQEKENIQLRVAKDFMFFSQIIRADNMLLISLYLSGKSGRPFPTIQIKDSSTAWFRTYTDQFLINWNRSRSIDFDEMKNFTQYLRRG